MKNRILRLPSNQAGRDFILGDLHGTTDLLRALMDRVAFDREKDRLFSVGDLVDRGTDSPGALALLLEPWFFAVVGNHEDMMVDYILHPKDPGTYSSGGLHAFLLNGSEWFWDYQMPKILLDRLRSLPLLIVVGEGADRTHVVHADLVRSFQDPANPSLPKGEGRPEGAVLEFFTDALIDAGLPWDETRFIRGLDGIGTVRESLLWDRTLIHAANLAARGDPVLGLFPEIPGLSPTFCGHTPLRVPLIAASHRLIDTGGYLQWNMRAGLSLCVPRSERVLMARRNSVGEIVVEERSFERVRS